MEQHSISVWFFIGLLLTIYGLLILATAVHELRVPPNTQVAMAHLHIGNLVGRMHVDLRPGVLDPLSAKTQCQLSFLGGESCKNAKSFSLRVEI